MNPTQPKLKIFTSALLLWVSLLVLTACGATPVAPPPPTRIPAPTFTSTPDLPQSAVNLPATATAQAAASGQTTPPAEAPTVAPPPVADTPTSVPPTATTTAPPEVVVTGQANVRNGPGTNYTIIGAATPGQRFKVTGKNQDGQWWQVDFNGQAGWLFAQLVTAQNTGAIQVATNIPAPPPTAVPAPTQPPAPTAAPAATQPPAAQQPAQGNFRFSLGTTEKCEAYVIQTEGAAYFNGFVRHRDNSLFNGVCVHIGFYGPRSTKCSGCDGVGDGNWSFSPFGGPAPKGVPVEIFVIACPAGGLPVNGQNENFSDLTPQSPKWLRTLNQNEKCEGITFYGD